MDEDDFFLKGKEGQREIKREGKKGGGKGVQKRKKENITFVPHCFTLVWNKVKNLFLFVLSNNTEQITDQVAEMCTSGAACIEGNSE